MPTPLPRFRDFTVLCFSVLVLAGVAVCVGQPEEPGAPAQVPANESPVAAPPDASPVLEFTPVPQGPPGTHAVDLRELRHAEGGVELFDRVTGATLRSYLPGRPATAWAHATADRWLVALKGGEVVEVNFATESVHDIATFGGDVHWLRVDQERAVPVLRMAIADHTIPGVGAFSMLYTIDPNEHNTSVRSIDVPFDSIYEDEWGRLWLLPQPGQRLSELHWLELDTLEVSSIEIELQRAYGWRRFGGVLERV